MPKKVKKEINTFYKNYVEILSSKDTMFIIVGLLFCFLTMYYADITVTGQYGITFLNSLFDGKILSFYANALSSGIAPEGAVYDIGTYVIFGIWEIPIWIFNKLFGLNILSIGSLLWIKLLPTVFMLFSVYLVARIAQCIGFNREYSVVISIVYMLSSTVFIPVLVIAQYDIIPLCFMLLGIINYIEKKYNRFYFFFALSMTVKPLTILILFLFVLLNEKQIINIVCKMFMGSSLMIVCKGLYSLSPAYRESCSGFLGKHISEIFASGVQGSYGNISLFILGIVAIYLYAYLHQGHENEIETARYAIILAYLIWAFFCAFGSMTSYWTIYMAPFAVLSVFMCKENHKVLTIDLVANVALTILLIMKYTWVYGGGLTYTYLVLKPVYKSLETVTDQGTTVAGILRRLSVEPILPVINAVMIACLFYIGYEAWKNVPYLSGDDIVDKKSYIWHIRIRTFFIYGWIAITLAAFAITIMGK